MEYWHQLVNEQRQKLLQEAQQPESKYVSVYSHEDSAILPPLMTPQRRREMQQHRATALAIEGYLKVKNECKPKPSPKRKSEPKKAEGAPLIVLGRIPQQLQRSKTVIYDNSLNRIIKFPTPTPTTIASFPLLSEEPPLMAVQRAAVKLCGPLFAVSNKSLVARAMPPAKPLIAGPRRITQKLSVVEREEQEKGQNLRLEHKHAMNLIQVAKAIPWGVFQIAPLLRSNTDPILQRMPHCSTETSLQGMPHSHTESDLQRKSSNTECSLRLHPQLWKRQNTVVHSCPNTPKKPICGANKKQQSEAQEEPKEKPKERPKEAPKKELKNDSKQERQSQEGKGAKAKGRFSLSPRRRALPHNVSCCGHAFSPSLTSATQRRRSYDPKASLMRDAEQKVAGKQPSPCIRARGGGPTQPPSSTAKAASSILTIAQEQEEQRQRFLALVSQQAEEQQRLQSRFEAQQQILIDQMLHEVRQLSSEAAESID
ncbi:uncharacterized protein LOC117583097 [Drosophila guanche]|uniref:Uncharacterized protein n=1 Tax=Drosophila guanche TaxID=7266 RepID=A0A3B0K5I7_DROGU|nr:uncharacterized protein LOC117583097 [Drosophila guanche]SPP80886.1 Hypothetical predicted protein [Drosophila guanche]